MSAEDDAYEAALKIIAHAREAEENVVSFDVPAFRALTRIPPELGRLDKLQIVYLGETQISDLTPLAEMKALWLLTLNATRVSDLSPLAGLTGLRDLDLDQTKVSDLSPLAGLTGLTGLSVSRTGVSDLSPLAGLAGLVSLLLDWTRVIDLRPIRGAVGLANGGLGLRFADTAATQADAELLRLSQLTDNSQRSRETLAYLNSLPPWPEPYTPKARPDGKAPQPIGGDVDHGQTPAKPRQSPARAEPPMSRGVVKVKTTATHIKFLLREPQMAQMTAQGVAEHIRVALREVRSRTNDLPEALFALEGVAEALEGLGSARIGPMDKNRVEELQLRIAQLEASLEKLTQELDAAKAAAKSDGFGAHFSKEAAGEIARTLGFVGRLGAVAGAVYMIGPNNPVAASFIAAWAAASKLIK